MSIMTSVPNRLTNIQRDRLRRGRRTTSGVRRSSRPMLEFLEERTLLSTFTVTDNSDVPTDMGSLRYNVINDPGGSTIDFASNVTGTITLSNGPLAINTNLTIDGPGAMHLAISGNKASQVFSINSGVTSVISGLTVQNGYASSGGGIQTMAVCP